MTISTNKILKTFQLILFLCAAALSCTDGNAQIPRTDDVNNKGHYEAVMKQRLDSLKHVVPKEHTHNDSLVSVLYEEYKQQYLNLGGTGKWKEALPIVLACEAIFIGHLSPKEEADLRSEEHTSELQSRENLVCRLLLEKKKKKY